MGDSGLSGSLDSAAGIVGRCRIHAEYHDGCHVFHAFSGSRELYGQFRAVGRRLVCCLAGLRGIHADTADGRRGFQCVDPTRSPAACVGVPAA